MDLSDAIYLLEEQKIYGADTHKFNGNLDSIKSMLVYGNKLGRMWDDLKGQMIDTNVMDRLETQYLGTRPKTRMEKIDDIVDMVEKARSGERTSATDILNALLKLRDEEKDV